MARIVRDPIDPSLPARIAGARDGAVLTFLGVVRETSRGRRVTGIEYQAYEGMAIREMARIEDEVRGEWPEVSIEIVHRVGSLKVGDAALLVAVASPHRAEGFEALRRAVERIKGTVPIWKKEIYDDGQEWVEGS
jgi:molybdopterin synthase catalytic subunit